MCIRDKSGGAMPHVLGVTLSLAKFNQILRVDPVSRTAVVQGGVRNLAQVFGTEWRPALVRMAQRRPADFAPYTAFFRAPVLFDQPRHEVLFQDADLDRAGGGAEP